MSLSRIKALSMMRYHLAKQAQWQRKVEARERENLQAAKQQMWGRAQSTLGRQTPLEYYVKRVSEGDFWLKNFEDNRNHHQKQALMWAAAAEALKENDS